MKKQITVCNRCEAPMAGSGGEFKLFSERRMDPAGSCENWFWVADLCPQCMKILVTKFLKVAEGWPQDQRKALATEFRAVDQRERYRSVSSWDEAMTADKEREMHELAVTLAHLTEGTGWTAMQYMAIGKVMEKLATYCAVCDCQKKVKP